MILEFLEKKEPPLRRDMSIGDFFRETDVKTYFTIFISVSGGILILLRFFRETAQFKKKRVKP